MKIANDESFYEFAVSKDKISQKKNMDNTIKNLKNRPFLATGQRRSLFKWVSARHWFTPQGCEHGATLSRAVSVHVPALSRYQIILLGDRGNCVLTTCPRLLPGAQAEAQTCNLMIKS